MTTTSLEFVRVTCRHCNHVNPSPRRFCAGCGQSLWDSCPNCNAANATSERFCGGCGTNIAEFLAEQQQSWRRCIDAARQLQAEFRFLEAQIALREAAKLEDPRFDEFAREAAALMQQFQTERLRLEDSARNALVEAKKLAQSHLYEQAAAVIEAIPEPARGAELQELLREVRASWQEMQTLAAEIRAALEAKKTIEVLPRLERLLALKPDHVQARQLGQQLALRVVVGARKLVADRKFDEAAKLLRQIPSFARDGEVDRLAAQAAEARWLLDELRTAPLATHTLLAIVDRARQMWPDHPEVTRQREALLQRLKQKPVEAWRAAADWAPPPHKTALGFPVDWLGGWRRIEGGDAAPAGPFREHPGRWCVACGLALQGLGQAAVETSLLPREESSVLSKLSFAFRRKPVTTAWGFDLSPTSLKAVKLRWDETANVARLEACELIEHATPADSSHDEQELVSAYENTLASFLAKHSVAGDKVCVNLPGLRLLGRFLQLPPAESKRLDDLVQYEARQQIPFTFEELCWDYHSFGMPPENEHEIWPRRVLVVAAKERHVRQQLAPFEKVKIKVDALQGDAVALHNFLNFDRAATNSAGDPVAILDVGSDATNIVVSGPDMLWFRTIGTASDEFTRALVREFKLTRAQAEQVKREPHRARRISQLYEVLDPVFAQLVAELERSLASFQTAYPGQSVTHLFGVGGGFSTHGLMRRLRDGR